jgi:hypothetical protein
MNIDQMEIPMTRSEFEHRFYLLENIIKNGKMRIARDISVESLLKVRRLPNGRLDFLSVDETARLKANMMLKMSKMDFPEELGSNDSLPQPPKED